MKSQKDVFSPDRRGNPLKSKAFLGELGVLCGKFVFAAPSNLANAKKGSAVKRRVVIVGMGFGGIRAARVLAGQGCEVVLVDRNNYHLFQPLLYQVATAG